MIGPHARQLLAVVALAALAACGGGGGGSTPPPPDPTPDTRAMVRGLDCSAPDSAGWCWQEPQPGATAMVDAHFIDADLGWAVGEGGTVLRTTDGGRRWTRHHIGASGTLSHVRFADAQTGWILGPEQSWSTRDGGVRWTRQAPMGDPDDRVWALPDGGVLRSPDDPASAFGTATFTASQDAPDWRVVPMWVHAVTRPAAARSTWHGVIVDGAPGPRRWGRSTDGGLSVVAQTQLPDAQWLLGLGALDGTSLWAQVAIPQTDGLGSAIRGYVRNQIVHSHDDGARWGPPLDLPTDRHIEVLALRADGHGLARSTATDDLRQGIGLSLLEATRDGGLTWAEPRTPDGALVNPVHDTQWLLDLRLAGGLWLSDDFGRQWTAVPAAPSVPYRLLGQEPGVLMFRSWPANPAGQIHRSRDRGQTWTRTPYRETLNERITQLWFFDAQRGLAVSPGAPGQLLDTTDGGRHWTPRASALMPSRDLHFTPGGTGWAISDTSTLLRSADRGQTWTVQPAPGTFDRPLVQALHFLDDRQGWAVVGRLVCPGLRFCFSSDVALFATDDGGTTWSRRFQGANASDFHAVAFASPAVALRIGAEGRLWRSVNGGRDWSELTGPGLPAPIDPLGGIHFADASVGFIGQLGQVLRTQDGGASWQRVDLPQEADAQGSIPQRFHFLDPQRAFAVVGTDLLLATTDGGHRWAAQRTGTGVAVGALFAVDTQRIWLGGSRGAILATATGGQ